MKKILTAILILTVFTASAQKPGAPPNIEERLKKTKEILGKELQLNASQLNTATEAFNKFFKQADLLHKGTTPPPSESQGKQIQGFEKERDHRAALGNAEHCSPLAQFQGGSLAYSLTEAQTT